MNESIKQPTELQIKWLDAMGGRTLGHVRYEDGAGYILMGLAEGGEERVYIPSDTEIEQFFSAKEEE